MYHISCHPANNIVVEGLGCHPTKEFEGRGVCLIHDAGDAGVATLVVRDGGEDRHDICDELLGVPVRLRDRRKSSRRRNGRVLLREVDPNAGGVVACYDITTSL